MVKISKTSKLDGIKSWSLQALDTCPGSLNGDGSLVDACRGCYATTGNYRFPNVKAPRLHNRQDWERLEWVDDMVTALDNERYFRFFDAPYFFRPPMQNFTQRSKIFDVFFSQKKDLPHF